MPKKLKNLIRIFLVVFLIFLLSFTLNAQESFAKLEPNRNIQAKDLIHKLNSTKDTLILRSHKKINQLYSINNEHRRDFKVRIDTTEYKLPLNKLPKGRHVFVAVQSPKRIVFVVKILKEIPEENKDEIIKEDIVSTEPTKVALSTNN